MLKIFLLIGFVVVVYSLIASIVYMRRQQNKELDKGMNATSVKHPLAANPMIIVYVLFPIAIMLGAAIWAYYF